MNEEFSGIKFRPVMGKEEDILALDKNNGYFYVATDTGKLFLDYQDIRKQVGGSGGGGGSSSSFVWANGDEEANTIVKDTDDASDGDPIYHFSPEALQGGLIPNIDVLILNADGRFFRVIDNTPDENGRFTVELIAVSGGGSGGGGGGGTSVADLDLTWSGIDLLGGTYIYKKQAEIVFIPNSTADETCSLSITVTDASNNEVYKRDFGRVMNNTRCVIDAAELPLGTNLTMAALVISDHSTYNRGRGLTKKFGPIKVLEMYVTKPADLGMMGVQSGSARLTYTPYYTGLWTEQNPVKIYYRINGGDWTFSKNLTLGNDRNPQIIEIPHPGLHETCQVDLRIGVTINAKEYTSESIMYEVPFIVANNEDPIIWTEKELGTIVRYEQAVVKYMVYSSVAAATGANIEVQFLKDGVLFDTAEVTYGNRWLTLDLTSKYDVGENHFSIVSGGARKDIDFTITSAGARELDLISEDQLEINFTTAGRSNKQIKSNRINFVSAATPRFASQPYVANLSGFNWYNNGWLDNNDGNGSYLSFSNGASAEIPMSTISINTQNQPWTFEMRFRIRNAKKFATLVTEVPIYVWRDKTTGEECASGQELTLEEIAEKGENFEPVRDGDGNLVMNEANTTRKIVRSDKYIAFRYLNEDNKGFAIGTQEAYFNVGGRVVNVKYREDEIINISFVVDKANNQLSIYLNGILSGVGDLSGIQGFSMVNIPFTINSEYCDFDLYKFRVYPLALTMPQVIHNYISDIMNIDVYDENQLTDENDSTGTRLAYSKLIEYNENHPDTPTMPYVVIDLSGETSTGNSELPYAKTAKGIDGTRIEFTNPTADYLLSSGQITPWQYYTSCPSYTANNVNINVQGTSSQIYPRRNFKTKFKKAKNWIYTAGPLQGRNVADKYYFNNDGTFAESIQNQVDVLNSEIAELTEADATGNASTISAKKAQIKSLTSGLKTLSKNWHEDSELFGSNKFTWKIDYMESSGSYNTGFANLLGNNIYDKHPLDDLGMDGEGYRTSVYGFPMLAFHKTSADTITYIGRYNYNLDKSANERYGFELESNHPYVPEKTIAEVSECWELRDNQGAWCSFRYPTAEARVTGFRTPISSTDNGIEVIKHFEARYHKDADQIEWAQNEIIGKENDGNYAEDVGGTDTDTLNSYLLARLENLRVLFNWLDSTDTTTATNSPLQDIIGQSYVDYRVSGKLDDTKAAQNGVSYYVDSSSGSDVNMGRFTIDSVEYRRQKFYNEFNLHLDKHYCAIYFVMTELLLCYDSRGKNMMIATFGPHELGGDYIWYPIFYDIDTQLGLNNVGAKLWDYDENCTFSTAQSVLWVNFNDLFKGEIISAYRILRGGGENAILSYKNIEGAYSCDPNVFKSSYAMRGRRPILAMGLDLYYKYVLPVSEAWRNQEGKMITANYLYACQGDRKLSRELLINNRLLYMDSKWLGGTFTISTGGMAGIMFRSTANHETTTSDKYLDLQNPGYLNPGDDYTLVVEDDKGNTSEHHYKYEPYQTMKYIDATPQYNVTPYLNFYVTTFTDENTYQNPEPFNEDKYPNGIPTVVTPSVESSYKYGRVDQQLNYFAGSSYISSLGDLSTKYANQVKIPNTPRLLDITLGSDAPDYFNNENLNPFELYTEVDDATGLPKDGCEKPLLEKIIFSNMRGMNFFQDVRSADKLNEFRALGTSLTYALFAEGAPLKTVHLPNTVERLVFIQNKNLDKIITTAPVVADMVNGNLVYRNHETYEGLYVAGVTDYVDSLSNRGTGCPVNEIDMEGDAMGYDSYTILNNLVLLKNGSGRGNRLSIKMTEVNWTPYTQVEYGESKQDNVDYFLLTDHSTYEPYNNPGTEWANDTLNGKVFTFNTSAPRATISDLSLLDTFIADYADTSTTINQFTNNVESEISKKTYPTLSGQLFVANGDAAVGVSESDLSSLYGAAWPNLVIRAEKVEASFLTKYVEIDPNSGKEVVLDNKAFSDTNGVSLAPASRLKVPTRTHYDFKGFSPNKPDEDNTDAVLYVVRNQNNTDWVLTEAGQAATVDAISKTLVLYAIFVPHNYQITYKYIDETVIEVVNSPYGEMIHLPSVVPYQDESGLPFDKKYALLGYNYDKTSSIALDMKTVKVNRDQTLYAIFTTADVHTLPMDPAYFIFTINAENQATLSFNPIYTFKGKITLPSYYENPNTGTTCPVVGIDGSDYNVCMNGISHNGGHPDRPNEITHIFFDTSNGPVQIQSFGRLAFYGCNQYLKYVEMPETLTQAYYGAFRSCYVSYENVNIQSLGRAVFQDNMNTTITEMTVGPDVEMIEDTCYSMPSSSVTTLNIGTPNHASKLSTNPNIMNGQIFFSLPNLTTVNIYTDNRNAAIWSYLGFTDFGSQNAVTINIEEVH